MRIAMRMLVGLAIPVLAFGWLTSAQLVSPPTWDPFTQTTEFDVLRWLLFSGAYFGAGLAVIGLVRALVGLWSMPELPLLPSRPAIGALSLIASLAALPHGVVPGVTLL